MPKKPVKSARQSNRLRPRRLTIEALERRELFSGISLVDGELRIVGSEGHDDAMVWVSGEAVCVGLDTWTTPGKPWLDWGQSYHWDVVKRYPRKSVQEVRFSGLGGDDWLETDVPVPTIARGGAGKDTLEVFGKAVNELYGGPDNDTLSGGPVVDYLYGEGGGDTIFGGSGNDVLYGGAGDDHLYGDDGEDHLYGGAGADELRGGDQDDTLVSLDEGTTDVLFGDAGTDSFWIDEEAKLFVTARDVIRSARFNELATNIHAIRQFENGADKTLDGDRLPDPGGGTREDGSQIGTLSDKAFASNPLFASSGPSQLDVRQGDIGDCGLLATLGAAARTDPNSIRQTVVDLGDGTYGVELGGRFYRVDNDLPTWGTSKWLRFAGLGRENSLWVAIVEKACAFHRTASHSADNTYGVLDGGFPSEAFEDIGHSGLVGKSPTSFPQGLSALMHIASELSRGKAVVVAIHFPVTGASLLERHAYMVERIVYRKVDLPSGLSVRLPLAVALRNPWGRDGAGNDGRDDGLVTVYGDTLAASMWESGKGIQSAWV